MGDLNRPRSPELATPVLRNWSDLLQQMVHHARPIPPSANGLFLASKKRLLSKKSKATEPTNPPANTILSLADG